ncbi:DUF6631 family protein [Pseudomonas tohonis]|uniref:DUF6631 family protein n=1 Tax=Pseudomonas tohonis TaxID=2725477 RepID=UPI001F29BBCE|nr:DUF6631 family protein [Pseudomonas tohonis]
MADKIAKPPRKGAGKPKATGESDLQVLHPEGFLTIDGCQLVVREYGFVEGLRLRPLMQPFLDDLHSLMVGSDVLQLEHVIAILGVHADAVTEAVAISADVDVTWLRSPERSQTDGMRLLMVWWTVNGPFYVRSVLDRIAADRELERLRAGQTPTPSSYPGGTEPPPVSAG